MKAKKVLFICSGIFNCVIGGIGAFFGLMFLLVSGTIKKTFAGATEMLDAFAKELAAASTEYEYLLSATNDEIVSFIMNIVFIISIILVVISALWITFGVFNLLLAKRHVWLFAEKPALKIWFVVGTWLLVWFSLANITSTIAVFLKDKNAQARPTLYTSEEETKEV